MLENALINTKSPRVNRAKNLSPPSREKGYVYQVGGAGPQMGPVGLIAPSAIQQQ